MEKERRTIPVEGLEIRKDEDGTPTGIGGSAALFNTTTVIAGRFEERITPGAFDEAIKASDVRGLFNHDPNYVLGRTKSGTMTVGGRDDGLYYDIPDLPKARADVLEAIEREDVTGNSFSFTVPEDGDTWVKPEDREDGGTLPLRTITKVGRLYDVGPVTFPAYEDTQVSTRAEQRAMEMGGGTPVLSSSDGSDSYTITVRYDSEAETEPKPDPEPDTWPDQADMALRLHADAEADAA